GWLITRLYGHVRFDNFHVDGVGFSDGGRLGDGRASQQSRFDFEGADEVAAGVDDVVIAPHEPEIAVRVDGGAVATQVPSIPEFRLVSGGIVPIAANLRRPAWAQRNQTCRSDPIHRF